MEFVLGSRSKSGACSDTGSFTFNDEKYSGYIKTATVWGSAIKKVANWSPTTSQLFLGEKALNYNDEEYVDASGTTVWDRSYSNHCESNIKEAYTGKANIFISKTNKETQIAVVEVKEENIYFSLHLLEPIGICGRHGSTTNLVGTSIIILQQYDSPLKIERLSSEDINLYDNLLSFIGYNNFMRGLRFHDVFAQFAMDLCKQDQRILENRMNIMKNHPADAVFEVDGKKGFIGQRRGAVIHIIKCSSSDASYRQIEEDTEEIPVFHHGRPMFVDPISFILKPNATKIESGTYLPIKWNIGSIWYCKHGKRSICNAPGQFEPENGKTANMLEYEELPMEGGMFTAEEVSAHEKTMFYEETRKKALDELGDDIVNLRPTKLTQSLSLDSMIDALYDIFLMAISTGHTKFAIFVISLYLLESVVGFFGRCLHIYKYQSVWWRYFVVAPFSQIFALSVLSWGRKRNDFLSDAEKSQIGQHVKIEINE